MLAIAVPKRTKAINAALLLRFFNLAPLLLDFKTDKKLSIKLTKIVSR